MIDEHYQAMKLLHPEYLRKITAYEFQKKLLDNKVREELVRLLHQFLIKEDEKPKKSEEKVDRRMSLLSLGEVTDIDKFYKMQRPMSAG